MWRDKGAMLSAACLMTDPQLLVSRLRRAVSLYDGDAPEGIDALIESHRQLLVDLHARLEHCVQLLRQGLISEAIHDAEHPSNLLLHIAAIDFAELPAWQKIIQTHRQAQLPVIPDALVVELDEAFPRAKRLENLLKRHRQLALAKMPLRDRIQVLRQLQKADAVNPVWQDDLLVLERARQKRIAVEIEQAASINDLPQLQRLWEEVNQKWIEPMQPALISDMKLRITQLEQRALGEKLETIWASLEAAHQNKDVAAAEPLLAQWKELQPKWFGQQRPEWNKAKIIASWVLHTREQEAEEAAWAAALRRMWDDLAEASGRQVHHDVSEQEDKGQSADGVNATGSRVLPSTGLSNQQWREIQSHWQALAAFRRPIPDDLQASYDYHQSNVLAAQRQRRMTLFGVAGVAAVVLVAVLGFVYQQQAYEQQIEDWSSKLNDVAALSQWSTAGVLLDEMDRIDLDLRNESALRDVVTTIEAGLTKERQRQQRFERRLENVRRMITSAEKIEAIESLKAEAQTPDEAEAVAQIQVRTQAAWDSALRDSDVQTRPELDGFKNRFDLLLKNISTEAPTANDINLLRQFVRSTRTRVGELTMSPELAMQAGTMLAQFDREINRLNEALVSQAQQQQSLQRIQISFRSPEDYIAAVNEYVEQYPNAALSQSFNEALRFETAWRAVDAMNQWVAKFNPNQSSVAASPLILRPQVSVIQPQLAQLESMQREYDLSGYTELDAYRQYLSRGLLAALPRNQPTAADSALSQLLDNPLVLNTYRITLDGRDQLYMPAAMPLNELGLNKVLVRYIANLDQARGNEPLSEEHLDRDRLPEDLTPILSAQSQFANQVQQQLAPLNTTNTSSNRNTTTHWHDRYFNLLIQLTDLGKPKLTELENAKRLDPILQAAMMNQLIDLSLQFDAAPVEVLQQVLQQLNQIEASDRWMDPFDDDVRVKRNNAQRVINELPDLRRIKQATLDRALAQLESSFTPRRPVGIFIHADPDQVNPNDPDYYQLMPGHAPLTRQQPIYTVIRTGQGWQFTTLGRTDARDQINWNTNIARRLPKGALIYQ